MPVDHRVIIAKNQFEHLISNFATVPVAISVQKLSPDPIEIFSRVYPNGNGFILEGSTSNNGINEFSYIGGKGSIRFSTTSSKIDCWQQLVQILKSNDVPAIPGLPDFYSGAIGYLGYEAVKHIEPSVKPMHPEPVGVPEAAFFIPDELIVVDHLKKNTTIIVLAGRSRCRNYSQASKRIDKILAKMTSATTNEPEKNTKTRTSHKNDTISYQVSKNSYLNRVERAKHAIESGELIQVVLSQRVTQRTQATTLAIYAELRKLNPSPHMFMFNFDEFSIIGASPELMIRTRDGFTEMHPIAGSRPRGMNYKQDRALESELIVNDKEKAEHLMLVDLARNDLGRVCIPGTIHVPSFMSIERYSHVMHLVSKVRGKLKSGFQGIDALKACFPMGTLTGAPKLRAIRLITELEHEGRGPYCGAIGWFGANGNMETGTLIRSIILKDGLAHVQGGGGIVFDSDPTSEYNESLSKMEAPLVAIRQAKQK